MINTKRKFSTCSMILNEDYFDKLDIKDSDIDDITDDNDSLETVEQIYNNVRRYEQTIRIAIDRFHLFKFPEKIDRLPNVCNKLSRRLDSLLDVYCIEHSDIYLVFDSAKSKKYRQHTKERQITDCGSYIMIDPDDDVSFADNDMVGYIYVYVNYPKMSIKRACDFIYMLHNLLWLEVEYYYLFSDLWLYDAPKLFFVKFDWNKQYTHFSRIFLYDRLSVKNAIKSKEFYTRNIAIYTVSWFFGRKTKERFEKCLDDPQTAFDIKPVE